MADTPDDKPIESKAPDEAASRPRGLAGRLVPRSPKEAIQPVAAPPPPPVTAERRHRPVINFISGFLSLVMVLALLAGGALFVGKIQFYASGPLSQDKIVMVRGGLAEVADQLQREGVIEHPYLFMGALQVLGKASQLKGGEYQFKQNASLADVMDTLVEGKAVLHSLTVPEGLTSQQIVDRLKENDILTGEVKEVPKEGSLLPDTYKFARGMSRQQLIERMQQDEARVLREVWARRSADLPLKSPQELLILASIVEKETGKADERSRVASVFINRLNRNMKLQSDPTIVYGLVGGKGTLGRGILRSEIDQATPYNTYAVVGLPPGPIANPGKAALEAVANPSRTRELYFVADGTGGHVFAETLEQHQKNVVKWRQIEGERRDAAPAPDVPAAGAQGVLKGAVPDDGSAAADGATSPAVGAAAPAPGAPATPPAPAGKKGKNGKTTKAAPANPTATAAAVPAAPDPPPVTDLQPVPINGPRGNLDAVAGTAKDPLLNRTFDLNSPKTVPPLKP
jgi:UPF0755 protein